MFIFSLVTSTVVTSKPSTRCLSSKQTVSHIQVAENLLYLLRVDGVYRQFHNLFHEGLFAAIHRVPQSSHLHSRIGHCFPTVRLPTCKAMIFGLTFTAFFDLSASCRFVPVVLILPVPLALTQASSFSFSANKLVLFKLSTKFFQRTNIPSCGCRTI